MSLYSRIESIYNTLEGSESAMEYDARHGIDALGVLTVYETCHAIKLAGLLRPQIEGLVVAEIGAGVGLLAIELAKYAKCVWAFEADPAWSWAFVEELYRKKPANLSWVFGRAEEFAGQIRADVALFVTRSGREQMREVAEALAPKVIDVTTVLAGYREEGGGDDE